MEPIMSEKKTGKGKLGRKLLLSITSLVVFFGALEIIFRLAGYGPDDESLQWTSHPDLDYIPAPDQDTWFGKDVPETGQVRRPIRINRYGQRGKDYPLEKEPGEFRIIGLGDSLTFGPGVRDEDTYLAQLEAMLRKNPASGE